MSRTQKTVLVVGVDTPLRRLLLKELQSAATSASLRVTSSLAQAKVLARPLAPALIVLEESAAGGSPLQQAARELAWLAPVVVLGGPQQQGPLAPLMAEGSVDFVASVGAFAPVAAALVKRRLRGAHFAQTLSGSPVFASPEELAETLRHELNNPLTGILGNAELLLARRDRLPQWAVLRLEIIADLGARLRETIRQLAETWTPQEKAQSASST